MTTTAGSFGLSRRSLADQVAEALVQFIFDEGLGEGDALPSTAELSTRFGVSRTVVREALAALTGQGMLSRGQGRDCVVAMPGTTQLTSLLRFRSHQHAVDAVHIMATRMALEVVAAEEAAARRTDDDIAALAACMEQLAGASNEHHFHDADIALHRAIAEASGNPLITLILDALADILRDLRVTATKNRRRRGVGLAPAVAEHGAIVDAIVAGDSAAAARAMREHLDSTAAEFNSAAR